MTSIPCFQVDAFATRPFTGNPAAVCPLERWLPDPLLQQIAAENALSETAFFVENRGVYDLRWFTPEVEVDLCGHATLASAHVLMTVMAPLCSRVRFQTKSGPLEVTRGEDGSYVMDFPSRPPVEMSHPSSLLFDGLGISPRPAWLSRDIVVVLDSAEQVRALCPDMTKLKALAAFAVCVTAPGTGVDSDVDFVSRFFAPGEGVPEDPVTGSAHCTLAPFWAARLGKTELRARQVSRRTGEVGCEVRGDRVSLTGRAVTTRTGTFLLPSANDPHAVSVEKNASDVESLATGVLAVIFTSVRTGGHSGEGPAERIDDDGYGAMADAMVEGASKQPGFLGIESARGENGLGITVSYWASEEAIARWKSVTAHKVAQRRGKERWYRAFRMRICRVERAYAFGDATVWDER